MQSIDARRPKGRIPLLATLQIIPAEIYFEIHHKNHGLGENDL